MMQTIDTEQPLWVKSRRGDYPVWVMSHAYQNATLFKPLLENRHILVVSHQSISDHYFPVLEATARSLSASKIALHIIPEGDQHKTISQAEALWTHCLENQYRRDALMIALGGGVVGDLTGFAASCYLRGIDFIQCPTSLLAQIDAAIGGKTAVNHVLGKNLIGAFYSPQAVIIDPTALLTLPKREFNAGLAEMIKYGLILDANFFNWIEKNASQLYEDMTLCKQAIYRSCQLKTLVVSEDEFESHHRMILNFGHTIAHAIESLLDFKSILHGEAVAIGMVIATHLACELNALSYTVLDRLVALLEVIGLPTHVPNTLSIEAIIDKISLDKKYNQTMHWVLLSQLGCAEISSNVDVESVKTILGRWKEPM